MANCIEHVNQAHIPHAYAHLNTADVAKHIPQVLEDDDVFAAALFNSTAIITIIGAPMQGKTRFATSLMCEMIKRRYDRLPTPLRYRYVSAESAFAEFRRDTFDQEGGQWLAAQCNVLILDDADEVEDRDHPALARMINTRSTEQRITILTATNLKKLQAVSVRSSNRISRGLIIKL